MAQRDREHESMKFHPAKAASKTWVFCPERGKQCVPSAKAIIMVEEDDWYNTPADFPAAVKKAEEKKAAETLSAAQQAIKVADRKQRTADKKKDALEELIAQAREAQAEADEAEALADELNSPSDNVQSELDPIETVPVTPETPPETPTSEQKAPVSEQSDTSGEADGTDSEEDEGPQEINPPAEFVEWTKEQMEDWATEMGLTKGLDLRKNKPKIIDEVIALCQDYNAALKLA